MQYAGYGSFAKPACFRTLFAVCLLLILLGTTISNSGLSGLRQI